MNIIWLKPIFIFRNHVREKCRIFATKSMKEGDVLMAIDSKFKIFYVWKWNWKYENSEIHNVHCKKTLIKRSIITQSFWFEFNQTINESNTYSKTASKYWTKGEMLIFISKQTITILLFLLFLIFLFVYSEFIAFVMNNVCAIYLPNILCYCLLQLYKIQINFRVCFLRFQ